MPVPVVLEPGVPVPVPPKGPLVLVTGYWYYLKEHCNELQSSATYMGPSTCTTGSMAFVDMYEQEQNAIGCRIPKAANPVHGWHLDHKCKDVIDEGVQSLKNIFFNCPLTKQISYYKDQYIVSYNFP